MTSTSQLVTKKGRLKSEQFQCRNTDNTHPSRYAQVVTFRIWWVTWHVSHDKMTDS